MSATKRICLECGAEFVPRHHSQTICSDECRRLRDNRLCEESRARCAEKKRKADAAARNEKANRRAAFFAARDAAFESIGLPPERVRIAADGTRIISRGNCGGYVANHNTFTAPSGGAPEARKSRRQKTKPSPANLEGTR